MKTIGYLKILIALLLVNNAQAFEKNKNIEFVIIIPSYNNQQWYKNNLDSIMSQHYDHFEVIYINDCSNDLTGVLVNDYIKKYHLEKKLKVIHNKNRCGALGNLYNTIHTIADHKVIVTVDGDDQLAHPYVLEKLAQEYTKNDIVLTYGQYACSPINDKSFCEAIPDSIAQRKCFRAYKWVASHLRTFYAGLFKKIKKQDLLWQNQFYTMAWDLAMMFPMLEMASNTAQKHFKYINEILYIYNNANPLNDHKVNKQLVQALTFHIRSRPAYAPLKNFDFAVSTTKL